MCLFPVIMKLSEVRGVKTATLAYSDTHCVLVEHRAGAPATIHTMQHAMDMFESDCFALALKEARWVALQWEAGLPLDLTSHESRVGVVHEAAP